MKAPNLNWRGIDPHSPAIPMVGSLILPGCGQLYNGEPAKAAIVFLLFVMAWITAWPFLIPIVLYGAYDAYANADRIKHAAQSEEKARAVLTSVRTQADEFVEKIDKLHLLAQGGILTDAEYDARVSEVIAGLEKKPPYETPEDFLTALIPIVRSGALKVEQLAKIKAII